MSHENRRAGVLHFTRQFLARRGTTPNPKRFRMTDDVIDNATTAMRDSLAALEAKETRLTDELATLKEQRKALQKAVESLSGDKPRRRRGRPRKTPEAVAA